jgi:hypothetical protein
MEIELNEENRNCFSIKSENEKINELLICLELIKDKLILILDEFKSCENCLKNNSLNYKSKEVLDLIQKYNDLKNNNKNNLRKSERKKSIINEINENEIEVKANEKTKNVFNNNKRRRGRPPKKLIKKEEKIEIKDNKKELTKEEKKSYVCEWPQCSRVFNKKSQLVKHRFSHSSDKPFACDWIGCNFRANRSLIN